MGLDSYNLTTEDVATRLGYHVQYLRFLASEGKIPAVKRGRAWRFSEAEITTWLKKQTTKAVKGTGKHAKGNDQVSEMLR